MSVSCCSTLQVSACAVPQPLTHDSLLTAMLLDANHTVADYIRALEATVVTTPTNTGNAQVPRFAFVHEFSSFSKKGFSGHLRPQLGI